ncbi:PIN-like domain-containing protein [Brevundimonas sp. NIBR11]|uniref:PIN-like domain-containing protein n=1 Tax=Brevundimonas sp. NIBR11 TaxID=3015999 RepID=UPI0022F07C79|nr:PIN-like domain-containing protein [Brevundimonas sp. NIBR11]WGM32190.1 hypothetical protein KKHFBJBL_02441 [Brevundimonas sp. NIBR11]
MRTALHQFFRPTEAEFEALWRDALFSFDASALLNLYGYSEATKDGFLGVMDAYKPRVVLPFQFALEYSRNRASTIVKQVNQYNAAEADLSAFARKYIETKRSHPYLSKTAMEGFAAIGDDLVRSKKQMESLIGNDQIADRVLDIFDGRIGAPPTEQELNALHVVAQSRIDNEIPPGYCDLKKKGVPGAFGDYIAWSQLIGLAKSKQKPIILVIDDSKEDWWYIEKDRTIASRPELVAEFLSEVGEKIWIYSSDGFLRAAEKYSKIPIDGKTLDEVSERLEGQRKDEIMFRGKPAQDSVRDAGSSTLGSAMKRAKEEGGRFDEGLEAQVDGDKPEEK